MNAVFDRFVTQSEHFSGDCNLLWAKTRLNTSEDATVEEHNLQNNKGAVAGSVLHEFGKLYGFLNFNFLHIITLLYYVAER